MRSATLWAGPLVLGAALCLAGCGGDSEEKTAAQARADAKAISDVIAQQTPPPLPVRLLPIGSADKQHNPVLERSPACSFRTDGADDPLMIADARYAFLKYEGSVHRLAPDAGSGGGPLGTKTKYDGREYSLRIMVDEGTSENGEGEGAWTAPATIAVLDGYERRVAGGAGELTCGD